MLHNIYAIKKTFSFVSKAHKLYVDFKIVKDIIDPFLEKDCLSDYKYSGFVYKVINEVNNLNKDIRVKQVELDFSKEQIRVVERERDLFIRQARVAEGERDDAREQVRKTQHELNNSIEKIKSLEGEKDTANENLRGVELERDNAKKRLHLFSVITCVSGLVFGFIIGYFI